jgi:hypothetical protein
MKGVEESPEDGTQCRNLLYSAAVDACWTETATVTIK